jgi:hypothetical protein
LRAWQGVNIIYNTTPSGGEKIFYACEIHASKLRVADDPKGYQTVWLYNYNRLLLID